MIQFFVNTYVHSYIQGEQHSLTTFYIATISGMYGLYKNQLRGPVHIYTVSYQVEVRS